MDINEVKNIIKLALEEDIGAGDITTNLLVAPDEKAGAVITVKEQGIICGLDIAEEVFMQSTALCGGEREKLLFSKNAEDGIEVRRGTVVAEVSGYARAILAGERTALNFLQWLSGIATLTGKCVREVERVSGRAGVFDTRKTMPTMRRLEKYAVVCGGGQNHRMGLWDMVLVKDNHLRVPGSDELLSRVKKKVAENTLVEVEVKDIRKLEETLKKGVDIILLDNMSAVELKKAVRIIGKRCLIEVSGGIDISNIGDFAKLGVDRISMGALTHSAKALDISLDLKPVYRKKNKNEKDIQV